MAPSATDKNAKWEDRETLDAVRPAVREMLLGAPAFAKLAPEEQQQIAKAMVRVGAFLANPEGVITQPAGSDSTNAFSTSSTGTRHPASDTGKSDAVARAQA